MNTDTVLTVEELATLICALSSEDRAKLDAIVASREAVKPDTKFVVRIANDAARAAAIGSRNTVFPNTGKIDAIKSVRIATGLGLGDAKNLVEDGRWYAMSGESANNYADAINRAWRCNYAPIGTDPTFVLATVEPVT